MTEELLYRQPSTRSDDRAAERGLRAANFARIYSEDLAHQVHIQARPPCRFRSSTVCSSTEEEMLPTFVRFSSYGSSHDHTLES